MTTTPHDSTPVPVSLVPAPAAKAGGDLRTLELPSSVVAAGRRHVFTFYLAESSIVRAVRWSPGFRLENFEIGTGAAAKRFGDGSVRVEGRGYNEHRVLAKTLLSFQVINDTKEDRMFSGEITLEPSPVIDERDLTCSMPDLAADDTAAAAPGGAST